MIIAICRGRIFSADIDDGMAGCEKGRVARTDESRWLVGREKSEKVDG
jgi:predicted transcriptional regulator